MHHWNLAGSMCQVRSRWPATSSKRGSVRTGYNAHHDAWEGVFDGCGLRHTHCSAVLRNLLSAVSRPLSATGSATGTPSSPCIRRVARFADHPLFMTREPEGETRLKREATLSQAPSELRPARLSLSLSVPFMWQVVARTALCPEQLLSERCVVCRLRMPLHAHGHAGV